MSSDFSIKPVGTPVATPLAQPASPAANEAVATELPAHQSVAAADAAARVRNDTQNASDNVTHQVILDRDAGSIVYQVVDNRTNTVVEQYPDEAILRRRAYFHTLDLTKGTPTRLLVTDRKA